MSGVPQSTTIADIGKPGRQQSGKFPRLPGAVIGAKPPLG